MSWAEFTRALKARSLSLEQFSARTGYPLGVIHSWRESRCPRWVANWLRRR